MSIAEVGIRPALDGADCEKLPGLRLERVGQNAGMRGFKQPSETFGPYEASAPTVQPDRSTAARRTAVEIENAIRLDTSETGVFIDSDGQVLLRRQGLPDQVTFTERELLMMRGATFTHNHPGGSTFSIGDVDTAKFAALTELRAVTADFRFIMRDLVAAPPLAVVEQFREQAQEKLAQTVRDMVKRGIIHPAYAQKEIEHQFWVALSQRYGFFYRRERS